MGNGKNNKNKQKNHRKQLRSRRQGGRSSLSAVVGNIHRDLQLTSQVIKMRIFQNPAGFTVDQVNAACGDAANDVTTALAAIDQAVTSLGTVIAQAAMNAVSATSTAAPVTVSDTVATTDVGNTTA